MANVKEVKDEALEIARRWCAARGQNWPVGPKLGKGGTAPVFEVTTSGGPLALKIYDAEFSTGEKGQIEEKRIEQQLTLKGHDCPYLVQIYDGGRFEERLFLLMSRASGTELEKRLKDVPRSKIRHILDQVTRAAIFLKNEGLCHRDIKAANIFISDDFEHCTLLDISVIRNVSDPIGMGTDHDGQLPFVATARYAPPEYLFRLLEPSPELWHALNVYQLGALLHDLIMKEPLFEEEYQRCKTNRYRFAWIIATNEPLLQATDVDGDLLLTARRALDKDWTRRSTVRLEDFLAEANIRREHALQVLGIGIARPPTEADDDVAERLGRVHEVAVAVEQAVTLHLRRNGVTAKHSVQPGPTDLAKIILISWDAPGQDHAIVSRAIELRIDIRLGSGLNGRTFAVKITLTLQADGKSQSVDLPDSPDTPAIETSILAEIIAALEKLATLITSAEVEA
jgi:Protein kinase domain